MEPEPPRQLAFPMSEPDDFHKRLLDAAVDLMGRAGRGGAVRVRGRSMLPTLEPGDVLAVEFSPGKLRRGDLIVFRQDDVLVVHRLVWRQRDADGPRLRCRGDGARRLDPPVTPDQVVGRVFARGRGEGWRGLRGPGARLYGWFVAHHDLCWALVNRWAGALERRLSRRRVVWSPAALAWAVDQRSLRLAHRVFFPPLHREIPRPREAGDVSG